MTGATTEETGASLGGPGETSAALGSPRVLLALRNAAERERLAAALSREGLRVATCGAGDALRRWETERPQAIVLDADGGVEVGGDGEADGDDVEEGVGAGADGLELCRRLRASPGGRGTGVLLLGRSLDNARVLAAYEAGADAVVAPPCGPCALAARLRALTRPTNGGMAPGADRRGPAALAVGGWQIDLESREARGAAGRVVSLAGGEVRLLALLAANAGHTVPTARLRECAETASVRQCVSRLRRGLGLPATGPGALESHAGLGYRLARA